MCSDGGEQLCALTARLVPFRRHLLSARAVAEHTAMSPIARFEVKIASDHHRPHATPEEHLRDS